VNVVLIAGLSAAVAAASAAAARRAWLFLGKAFTASMREAITSTVQPQLSSVERKLGDAFELMRAENRVDHDRVAAEIAALEVRVSAVETVLKEMSPP
jgi:HAMP domain-containing protein